MQSSTPINDFITEYEQSGTARFHMPGHKGKELHGMEQRDITEIKGADYLYDAQGIIGESEALTSELFGSARTLYSTEGSSLSIKTMLGIIKACKKTDDIDDIDDRVRVLAPRNVHKAFIDGCCLLDIDVKWVYPESKSAQLCASNITPSDIELAISECGSKPDAVYITSPDYLGNMADITGISAVCRNHGIPLLVDNAHGAYLKFLERSLHPLDLGADMCADSAHKTLPVYTGGGYLHIAENTPKEWLDVAKETMSLFASTSPSYLIMQSLDKCCGELQGDLPERIRACAKKVDDTANRLCEQGWEVRNAEPLKLTIYSRKCGYSGDKLADMLREKRIECEYSDTDCVVLMCSPYNDDEDYERLVKALSEIPVTESIADEYADVKLPHAVVKLSIRQAYFSPHERVSVDNAEGRICARSAVSCQPSVPIVIAGEEITGEVIKILKRYSIFYVDVI